jgi:DNA-directed RNA polymerase specialized sigma subunit
MGTIKRGAHKIQKRLKQDFMPELEDLKSMFTLGLNKPNQGAPISMYAMPGVDLMMTNRSRKVSYSDISWHTQQVNLL